MLYFFIDDQEKASYTENIGDTAFKEIQETVAEATRSSQPPRTPSRASRSSSMVSPTKVSTRNALRTATTPNSSKQSTSGKLQYTEKSYETLTIISESTSEEHEAQQEEILKYSPEKLEEKQENTASNIIQNKTHSPLSVKSQEEAKHVNILEDNKYEANVLQVPVTESSEKASTIACVDRFSIPQEEHETKSSIDEVYKVQKQSVETKILEEKTEIKENVDVDKVQDTSEKDIENKISVEQEDVNYRDDTYNDKNTLNIPEVEQSHVIPDQVDKTNNIEIKDEKITNDNYTVQDETMDVSVNIEDVDEKTDNIPQDKQVYLYLL